MKTTVLVLCFLLGVYSVSSTCTDNGSGVAVSVDELQDYVRSRVDEYRQYYSPGSVLYATEPKGVISLVAQAKATRIPLVADQTCSEADRRYQWTGTEAVVPEVNCCGFACAGKFVEAVFAEYGEKPPSDISGFDYVVSPNQIDRVNAHTIERAVDEMVNEPEAVLVILGAPNNRNWGVGIGESGKNNNYLVFATGEDTMDVSKPASTCGAYVGTRLASTTSIPTLAPVAFTVDVTTTNAPESGDATRSVATVSLAAVVGLLFSTF